MWLSSLVVESTVLVVSSICNALVSKSSVVKTIIEIMRPYKLAKKTNRLKDSNLLLLLLLFIFTAMLKSFVGRQSVFVLIRCKCFVVNINVNVVFFLQSGV